MLLWFIHSNLDMNHTIAHKAAEPSSIRVFPLYRVLFTKSLLVYFGSVANVKPPSLDMNRVDPPEITIILQINARPISKSVLSSHLLSWPMKQNDTLAGRAAAPDASPPSTRRISLVRRHASLRPSALVGPLPFTGARLRRLLISLRGPAPCLSGPPSHLTPPPSPALCAACCHSPCLQ
jgi:hypothetical protein